MPLIDCKIELRLTWKKYCVLAMADNDNTNTNSDNIIFKIKFTKLYLRVVTLSIKGNQNLSTSLQRI